MGIRSGSEEPAYTVVETIAERVEIRQYPPRLAVQTTVNAAGAEGRNEAFQRLFDYISGANQPASEVAMTVPVEVSDAGATIEMTAPVERGLSNDRGTTMRFFLPSSYSPSTAPVPSDPRVALVELPATTTAALRFSGARDDESVDGRTAELLDILARSSWAPVGGASALFYDPPWTIPLFRRNEVIVPAARSSAAP